MSKKTWKNMTLRSGKLAWRSAVFVLTVGAILAAKALKLLLVGAFESAANGGAKNKSLPDSTIDTTYIMTEADAFAELSDGRIGAAEYVYFRQNERDCLG